MNTALSKAAVAQTRFSLRAKIAVDASCLMRQRTGIGHYTANSVAGLMDLLPDCAFDIFLGSGWSKSLPGHDPGETRAANFVARLPMAHTLWRLVRRQRFLSHLGSCNPDLVLTNFLPPAPCDPVVPIVHDLSPLRMPEAHPGSRVRGFTGVESLVQAAPAVITVSEFSKREILEAMGIEAERVFIAPPGVDGRFRPTSQEERRATLSRHGLQDKQFFLAVGTLEPRKNLKTLIDAYARLPDALRERHALAIGGGVGWGDDGLKNDRADRLHRTGQLRLLGYVPGDDLPHLYGGAKAFCFPSLYEGFGMPVIEALACGTPVLASSAASIPEAAGPHGVLLDPRDVEAWSDALMRVSEDQEIAVTASTGGPAWASRFTWQGTAQSIAEAIAFALETSGTARKQ